MERIKRSASRIIDSLYPRLIQAIATKASIITAYVWYVVSAAWIAVTANYDVLHDEKFHFGIIKRYAEQFSPFISSQSVEEGYMGDIVRNTSYLYHYILSFPYRIIKEIFPNEFHQLVSLRFINIFIGLLTLLVIRATVLRVCRSRAIANLVTFMFGTTTMTLFVAAAVNYENLFVLLFSVAVYFVVDILHNKDRRLSRILLAISVMCFASLTKYTFLPIAVTVAAAVVVVVIARITSTARVASARRTHDSWIANWLHASQTEARKIRVDKGPALLIAIVVALIGSFLFLERYGLNFVRYGTPTPDCSQVQTMETCMRWTPYARNQRLKNDVNSGKITKKHITILQYYDLYWFDGMRKRVYAPYTGLDAPADTAVIRIFSLSVLYGGLIAYLMVGNKIRKKYPISTLLLLSAGVYFSVLLLVNYANYEDYGAPVAIQGRYALVFLPWLYMVAVLVFRELVTKKRTRLILLLLTLLAFFSSGVVSYIQLTTQGWYFPRRKPVEMSNTAKRILLPFKFIIVDPYRAPEGRR